MKIVLTFDIERDIPGVFNSYLGVKNGLPRLLEILEEFSIKGTFFCTGDIIEHLPKNVKEIEHKNHELACHGLNHERLNQLEYDECYDLISRNKVLLENLCHDSEINGFRAPYLKAPLFLFEILTDLGFKYDSSISSRKIMELYQVNDTNFSEFPPSNYNTFFRFPLNLRFLLNRIYKKDLTVLYFHPWEAINMRNLIFNQRNPYKKYKTLFFRPDRWVNTGEVFLNRFRSFIEEAISKGVKFVTLNELISN